MRYLARNLVLLFAFLAAHAPTVVAQEARFLVPTDTVSVGDRFRVAIVVDRPEYATALFPDPARGDSTLGDLEILDVRRNTSISPASPTLVRDSISYEVTTFALDTAFVPAQRVLIAADGDTTALLSSPAEIPVRSLVPEGAEEIQDIAPIVKFRPNPWPWIILAGIILLVAAVVYFLLRRRRRAVVSDERPPPPLVPPYEEAVQRLERLREMDLQYDGDQKPYYVELSDIVRTYVERQTGLPALESTTRELMRHLDRLQAEGFPSTAVARIRMVLERSDFVKFADAKLPPAQGRDAADEARRLVDEVEEALRAAEARSSTSVT